MTLSFEHTFLVAGNSSYGQLGILCATVQRSASYLHIHSIIRIVYAGPTLPWVGSWDPYFDFVTIFTFGKQLALKPWDHGVYCSYASREPGEHHSSKSISPAFHS